MLLTSVIGLNPKCWVEMQVEAPPDLIKNLLPLCGEIIKRGEDNNLK